MGRNGKVLFQSTPLMRGKTLQIYPDHITAFDFNPLPSREGRRDDRKSILDIINFNPLPSCEGRLAEPLERIGFDKFQSTPLMRGETLARRIHAYTFSFQSTPLMRGETRLARDLDPRKHISIHSPHARGDHGDLSVGCHAAHFNPLPSCEGRRISALTDMQWRYFNPLPSCEGRLVFFAIELLK